VWTEIVGFCLVNECRFVGFLSIRYFGVKKSLKKLCSMNKFIYLCKLKEFVVLCGVMA
jgi:hypothetical protein